MLKPSDLPRGETPHLPRPLPEDEGEQRPAPPDEMEEEIPEEDWRHPWGFGRIVMDCLFVCFFSKFEVILSRRVRN